METRKKILYLQPTFDLDLPRNIRTTNIISYLCDDFDIEVFCFESKEQLREMNSIKIHRLSYSFWSKYVFNKTFSGYKPKGFVRFISRALNFLLSRFLFPDEWIIEKNRVVAYLKENNTCYDFVIASMIPFSMGEIALELKKQHLTKHIILDIGDPLSENAANLNDTKKEKKKAFEVNLLNKADVVVVTNELTKSYYNSITPETIWNKIVVISQGVNEKLFKPSDKSTFDLEYLKIIYAGIFYPKLREPDAFFDVLIELKNKNISCEIYGEANRFGLNEEQANVKFLPRINQADLAIKYNQSNLILYIDNAFGIQTSGKIFELLMLKIPILMLYNNENSPVLEIVKDIDHVFIVKNDVQSIRLALEKITALKKIVIKDSFDTTSFTWKEKALAFKKNLN